MFYICRECCDTRRLVEVIILNCTHCFCLVCFEKYLLQNMNKQFKCPLSRCSMVIEYDQIRMILSESDLARYDALCMEGLPDIHKCILSACNNASQHTSDVINYTCQKCSLWNCIRCNASHAGITCDVYSSLDAEQATAFCQVAMENAKAVHIHNMRQSMVEAAKKDLYVNDRVFECMLCCLCIGKGNGIRLRSCFHYICRPCLIKLVTNTDNIPVKCPRSVCGCSVEDREVKSILSPAEYEVYERKGLNRAWSKLTNAFQCQQANCNYLCELQNTTIKKFRCPKCRTNNCLMCRSVHPGKNCKEHKLVFCQNEKQIQDSLVRGDFMCCPECKNYVTKSRGCNWIKCSRCNVELCWILKMRRWGPKGAGDTSGGCKCEPDNLCHPTCTGCIPDNL